MGRGTIASNLTQGLYSVNLDYGNAIKTQRLATLTARKAVLDAQIVDAEATLASENATLSSLLSDLDAEIATYSSFPPGQGDTSALNDATVAANTQRVEVQRAESQLTILRINLVNVNAEIKTLNALNLVETREMWCADYTDNASGSVATIEVNGEQPLLLVAPGAQIPTDADGFFTDRAVQSGPQAYFNAAILPGWQKFLPTYRSGTIVSINRENDTCEVNLDTATSSAQSLNINQAPTLSNVSIEYMTCDSAAFTVFDEVIVQFTGQNWDDPKVIGFVSNPKVCGPTRIFFMFEDQNRYISKVQSTPLYWGVKLDPGSPTESFPENGYKVITKSSTGNRSTAQSKNTPASPGAEHETIRIRFDVSWVEPTSTANEFLVPEAGAEPVLTELNGVPVTDQYHEVTVKAPVDVSVSPSNVVTYTNWGTVNGEHCVYNFSLNIWICTQDETLAGGVETTQAYVYPSTPYIDDYIDTQHLSDYLLTYYTEPPGEITIEIDGGAVEYVFETLGVGPPCEDEIVTVPVADPPTGAGLNPVIDFTYQETGENVRGVIYRRKDLPAP